MPTKAMTGRRRLQILNELAKAEDGLPMFDHAKNCHRFYAEEIAILGADGLVDREHGKGGVYHITEQGLKYLAVMKPGQTKGAKKAQQQVAA